MGERDDEAWDEATADLSDVARRLRAEQREAQEELEEAIEDQARARRDLSAVALELMHRGDLVRVAIGDHSFLGRVVHVGVDLMTLADAAANAIDVLLPAMTSLRVIERVSDGGQARREEYPARFRGRLAEAEATGNEIEIGSTQAAPLAGIVASVGVDHVAVNARDGGQWILPLGSIGYLIRRPGRRR